MVEKEVVKTVEVPGETVVVTKEVAGPERSVVKEGRAGYVDRPNHRRGGERAPVWRDDHVRLGIISRRVVVTSIQCGMGGPTSLAS